jgi:hypothetical protein
MSRYETPTATSTSVGGHHYYDNSNSTGSGLFYNDGAGMNTDHQHKYASNDAHLGATTARDAETLSAGSTARNESTVRVTDGHYLEKDFSRQDRTYQSRQHSSADTDRHNIAYGNGYGGHHRLDASHDSGTALQQIRTAGSVSISPELFEKLYLSPQNKVAGELRKTFGNPTPLYVIPTYAWSYPHTNTYSALIGFLLALHPLSMTLMGWRGAGGGGAATTGWYYFGGGMLMLLGGIGEARIPLPCPITSLTTSSGSLATPSLLSCLLLSAPSGSVSLQRFNPFTTHMAPMPILVCKEAQAWSLWGLMSVSVSPFFQPYG